MRICVIGKSGQVAQALLRRMPALSVAHLVLARPEVDLEQPKTLAERLTALKPEIVINAAAYTAVDQAELNAELAFAINAEAPAVLAKTCAALGSILIHLSTDYVFDGRSTLPYREEAPTNPLNIYGQSKLAGERAVRTSLERHVILRTSWVHAAHGRNFVKTMLGLAAQRHAEIRVVCDQWGAPTYADDLTSALIDVARQVHSAPDGDRRFGTFHLTNGGDTSWAGFAEAIMDLHTNSIGHAPTIQRIVSTDRPSPARRPAYSVLNCAAIREAYGIRLPHWHNGLERCMSECVRADEDMRL